MQQDPQDESIVSGIYDNYQDTQKEILEMELKKTKNKLFTLAAIFFISDLINDSREYVNRLHSLYCRYPLLFVGLAFLSTKEPLLHDTSAVIILPDLYGRIVWWTYSHKWPDYEGRGGLLIIAGFKYH
jgi:hypothetical protein